MNSSPNIEEKFFYLFPSEEDPKRFKIVTYSDGRQEDLTDLLPEEDAARVKLLSGLFNDELEAKTEEVWELRKEREQILAEMQEHYFQKSQQLYAELNLAKFSFETKMAEVMEEKKQVLQQLMNSIYREREQEKQLRRIHKRYGVAIFVLGLVGIAAFVIHFVFTNN
uniref:Coiled-coil domain-containing protein 166 n=1 Tax=Steinernema glaseri TaxID=37863 RepID=A0A1I7ZIG1_9BILA